MIFVINPNAGSPKKRRADIKALIRTCFPEAEIYSWQTSDRRIDLRTHLEKRLHDTVVAVGGDGTVNYVAASMQGLGLTLGIIPAGSGNGLARQLKIPLDPEAALEVLQSGQKSLIDTGKIDGRLFLCTAGVGFDALIGSRFAASKGRGLWNYVQIVLRELFTYRPLSYRIVQNGESIERKAFLITFANAGQWGSDVYIAPQASMSDGMLDLCLLRRIRTWQLPRLALQLLSKKIHHSSLYETFKFRSITVKSDRELILHFDGEPAIAGKEIKVEVQPASLSVITL